MGDRTVISLRDWKILEKVIPKYISNNIDVDEAITLLFTRGYITSEDKQSLRSVYQLQGPERNIKLLKELLKLMTFDDIIRFLQDIGQNAFANDLKCEKYGSDITIPAHGTDIAVTRRTFRYYNNLKIQMDNNIFKHGRLCELKRRSFLLKQQLRMEQNDSKRQQIVNRYAVVTYQKVAQYRLKHFHINFLNTFIFVFYYYFKIKIHVFCLTPLIYGSK